MRDHTRRLRPAVLGLLLTGVLTQSALAAVCHNTGSFENWLGQFRKEALAQGISQHAISAAAPYMTYDQRIVNIDRGQRIFQQSFLEFSDRMLAAYRLSHGAALIKRHAGIFAKIEQQFGVPAPVIVAFWGLESDFGANMGKDQALRSITTLAYDCRRSDMFRHHLFDALRLIERGDLAPGEMVGSWAGELGQTQMMPSEYLKNAVDYDGDGRRNLLKSVPDVLASTANYLVSLGWRRGEPWLQEVRVPARMAWEEADLAIQHLRSQWKHWGVTYADGRALPSDDLAASLLLPMGRSGPAFLAYPNFQVYLKWNQSLVYSTTAAYYATRLAGAPPMHRGSPVASLNSQQIGELQHMLAARGYKVGEIDGKLGLATRAGVKAAQLKVGLPADSYPTLELIERLRRTP
jgi:lytic murein transglycosylase